MITGDFSVYDGILIIMTHLEDDRQIKIIDSEDIRRFITQNPYKQENIRNWEQLHNQGSNISVAIFGSIHDKNIDT